MKPSGALTALLVTLAVAPASPETLKELYGSFDSGNVVYNPSTARSVYATCFAGFVNNNVEDCYHMNSRLQGGSYPEENQGLNTITATWCLTCCSNTICNDDDFSDDTGQCSGGTGFNDIWRLHCSLTNPTLTLNIASRNLLTNQQFRFLRNRDLSDTAITYCPLPRKGYTFSRTCEWSGYIPGSPYCPKGYTSSAPEDLLTCDDGSSGSHAKCEDGVCTCEIPSNWFFHSGDEDNNFYITGYELELEVEERNDGMFGGTYWRAVNKCKATVIEERKNSARFNDDDGIEFTQYIHLYSKPKTRFWTELNTPGTLIMIFAVLYMLSKSLEYYRRVECIVCYKPMMFCVGRCFWCRLYGAEPPDPTLLRALQNRRRNQRIGAVEPVEISDLGRRATADPPPSAAKQAQVRLHQALAVATAALTRMMSGHASSSPKTIRVAPAPT